MTCNLESGSWCRAIWERLSTTHLVGTVASAEIDLDISNEDQRYNLPVNNHEEKTKVSCTRAEGQEEIVGHSRSYSFLLGLGLS